jgi:competence protein ComEC
MNISSKTIFIFVGSLVALNIVFWISVIFFPINSEAETYFLNVGQGDSELVRIGRANFLIDSGKDASVVNNLDKITPNHKKRIDVAFVSHGQTDHAGGMFYLLENYDIGYVIYNGDNTSLWQKLKKLLEEKHVPYVILKAGDKVIYGTDNFKILWPTMSAQKFGLNDNSMVIKYNGKSYSALFTADISSKVESQIISGDINSNIIKVPHHGSKFSSSRAFLEAVNPEIAVIEVGKNSYGHPTSEVLKRLESVGSKIFRTDINGIVKVGLSGQKLQVSALR